MSTRNPSDAHSHRLLVIIAGVVAIAISFVLSGWVYGPLFHSYTQPEIGTAVSIERPTCEEA
jgi:hypothetical protein